MDFPQQIEETLVERPASFDVTMDSLLFDGRMAKPDDSILLMNDFKNVTMNSSMVSNLEDSTPSDSGIQLLDSESLIESITSQNAFEFDEPKTIGGLQFAHSNVTQAMPEKFDKIPKDFLAMTKSDFENSNVADDEEQSMKINMAIGDDVMTTSNCSTFDAENIVYRRRTKKQLANSKTPKKRVSFHEDILKNTRTDNIHIEHGFITYKNGRKASVAPGAGRYSWCSQGDVEQQLCSNKESQDRRVVYRNACSDVLDYGNADVYEQTESNYLKFDNSGIFEYEVKDKNDEAKPLYKCSCSGSNSSLDSDEQDKNSNSRQNYGQAKSSSCDCIGQNNTNNNFIEDSCYFSEPNIEKSVWNKEKKPKSSCLKKTNKHTNIIHEQDISKKVKKFNVHDVNNLIDNSKMIFGSLKSIFTISLPERGVPEGSEDNQSVYECIPETEPERTISPIRQRTFLSKSLDGSKNKNAKKFVHNVDQQLRRNNECDLFAPTRQNSDDEKQQQTPLPLKQKDMDVNVNADISPTQPDKTQFRNKFIINCESTVFEHTGISFCFDSPALADGKAEIVNVPEKLTPPVESETPKSSFMNAPIKQTFVNIFKTLKETAKSPISKNDEPFSFFMKSPTGETATITEEPNLKMNRSKSISSESSDKQSLFSETTNASSSSSLYQHSAPVSLSPTKYNLKSTVEKQVRHLPSPMKKRSNGTMTTTRYDRGRMSPDLFNMYGGSGRDSKSTILSEEFDDILTITTDTDKNDSDIVIVDYPDNMPSDRSECSSTIHSNQFLKPPKGSLINRFLRNVTQKKIAETSIRKNEFFADKLKKEKSLFAGNLFVKGAKPKNFDLIEDLNAEIAMEIEMSGANSPRRELIGIEAGLAEDISRFELGIGEISIDIFNGNNFNMLLNEKEILMKVFKLYTGYSRDGHMSPVLVFLTDKTLYVMDLVRNRLCNKFVLSYFELDVILMGPYGNTVLLSNSARDMQQVLLAGGPYPADGLVANLELCSRRGGSILPAVGQLTLEHLAPLQAFVRQNSMVSCQDKWVYYAVVNVPAVSLNSDMEPLGPNVKGFFMHKRVPDYGNSNKVSWHAGYFLLKAGVLYMFNDSCQKIPTFAIALAECQGVRRTVKASRPHCFEILLKHEYLQLAAPDEYVASEWLQALVQSASGLFELQEKNKTLGCTLIMTENNLITLREDFTAPLRQINKNVGDVLCMEKGKTSPMKEMFDSNVLETSSTLSSSTMSTPTRNNTYRSNSSVSSTPTKMSQISQSTTTSTNYHQIFGEKSYTTMSSLYGKNAGVEVLSCAGIKEMISIRIPSHNESWWCILEFSCQEVRANSDDLVIFFASSSEMQRFLRTLERLWQAKNNDLFPIMVLDEDDVTSEQCTKLYMDINRSWEPLLSAALGYPL